MRTMRRTLAAVTVAGMSGLAAWGDDAPRPAAPVPVTEVVFEGRIGYRSWAGEFVSVVPSEVLVGTGDGACQFTLQGPADLTVGPDGSFRMTLQPSVVSVRSAPFNPTGEPGKPTCGESLNWPCYRFRATGCADFTIQLSADGWKGPLFMSCPGRRGPRKQP